MKNLIPAVKGTRDFYPEQMALRTWLYNTMREVAESFGYQEYEAPLLESLELYAAKSGEELVNQQSYVFKDRGGDSITLRPELTPSLARMVAGKQSELTFPVRWWSFGPFWRYERPQKGRTREFFQWNVDLLGPDTPEADAENVAVLATFLKKVGLRPEQVVILVNDRALMNACFADIGIPSDLYSAVSGWIDRRAKLEPEAWQAYGAELRLTKDWISKVEGLLSRQELWKESATLPRFFESIAALGVDDFVRYDPAIMRGLLYYTSTVFEAWEVGGEIRRSILGGGRYDNLLADVGGEPLPAVGFAMGDVVISLVLEKYGLLPEALKVHPAQVLVTVFDEETQMESMKIAGELRRGGLNVAVYPEIVKLGKQFKYADRIGARAALVLGPNEIEAGQVTVKDLASGEQVTIARDQVREALVRVLNSSQ
jgi:histidyl-tRNA synthetase